MGKLKARTIGDETVENKQKQQAKQKAAEKKFVKGGKGGERVVSVGPSEDELAKVKLANEEPKAEAKKETKIKKNYKKSKKNSHSASYQKVFAQFERNKNYKIAEALIILEKLKRAKFDETVELHVNTHEIGVSGSLTLPHGTGKTIRVSIANDALLADVAKNKIDFDILLAAPMMMPKLARVARILGPKGLMPNPKNGTLVADPEKAAENFKKGQIHFKTELKAPIIHLTVGKMSFGAKKLSENIESLIAAIKKEKIRNVILKSTMSPGIKLEI